MSASSVQQHARLDQHLKAVADAQDQLAGGLELGQRVGQVVLDLVAQDPAGRHVVAVAEPAGHAEDLEPVEQRRVLQQPVDVQQLGLAAGLLEGEGGFLVAVGARGTQDQDVGVGHTAIRGSGLRQIVSGFGLRHLAHHRSGFCQASFDAMQRRLSTSVGRSASDDLAAGRRRSPRRSRACGTPASAASKAAAFSRRTSHRNRVFDSREQQARRRRRSRPSPRRAARLSSADPQPQARRQRPSRRRPRPGRLRSGRGTRGPARRRSPGAAPRTSAWPRPRSTLGTSPPASASTSAKCEPPSSSLRQRRPGRADCPAPSGPSSRSGRRRRPGPGR